MTLRNCNICFAKPVFFSGETVSGKVNLTLEKKKTCTALMLCIRGEAKCSWSETQDSETVYYGDNETYFQTYNNLIAEQHVEGGTSHLVTGDHSFDFAFVLPENLPSSIEGQYGYVRYTAKVVMKRQYKIDLSYKISFTVLSHTDLNLYPQMSCPIQHVQNKNFQLLFLKKGTLHMIVKIPFSGYVSGQNIPVTCHFENDSKVKVESVKALLSIKIKYHAKSTYKCQFSKISRSNSGEIRGGEERTHDMLLYVPPTPTTTNHRHIIDISYTIKVTAVLSGMHDNISCTIPITIGTIPLVSTLNLPRDEGPSASTSGVSSAPPEYSILPSYKEAIVDKRMDENVEEWNHTKEFSPKYPVYNFEKK